MNIKRISTLLFASLTILLLMFSACKKYEDGPVISLRSKKARLTGEWKVVQKNGESISTYTCLYQFQKDNSFNSTWFLNSSLIDKKIIRNGTWDWENNKSKVAITIDGDRKVWEIKRLTNDEFWFEDTNDNEFKCEKQ